MQYRNHYYVLRHGRSLANEQGLIVSRAENGVPGYGLSPSGRVDTWQILRRQRESYPDFTRENAVCYSSDFSRASETAAIFCELYELDPLILDARLRERDFGQFELSGTGNYGLVWDRDRESATHDFRDAESTARVRDRLLDFVRTVEDRYADGAPRRIVCVSHGDPSQIFQTIFAGLAPNRHRELPHLDNAELRAINAPENSERSVV